MPPARSRPSRRPAARRRPARRRRGLLPVLDQQQLDLVGLTLVALGVLLAVVLWLGWSGGEAGEGIADGLRLLVGAVAYAAPVAFVAGGAVLVMKPLLPAVRPYRAGALCLLAAATLGLAAGTLGLGPDGAGEGHWDRAFLDDRGGLLGEALHLGLSTLFSSFGAHLAAVLLFVAGVLLVTGASVAGVLHHAHEELSETTSRWRGGRGEPAEDPDGEQDDAPTLGDPTRAAPAPRDEPTLGGEDADPFGAVPEPLGPPEHDTAEIVVRAGTGRDVPLDAAERFPDLYGGEPLAFPVPEVDATAAEEPAFAPEEVEAEAADAETVFAEEDDDPVPAGPARPVAPEQLTRGGRFREEVMQDPEFVWRLPNPRRLRRSKAADARPDTAGQREVARTIVEALGHFGVQAQVVGQTTGPHITRFELQLAPGTKVAKVAQLKDDLAYALAATDIRILAPIPGKQAVGVEVPNRLRRIVHLGDVFQEAPEGHSPLTVWLGKDVSGQGIGVDLAKMPHLLVAGTTGAGKSGCINAMLASLLLRADPHELRLVLVDPKQVELNHYEGIPHLLTPVITQPKLAAVALGNLVREMEERYATMRRHKARSLPQLNRVLAERGETPLPYVLCIIDELADLMMVAPADVEDSIIRLAQKARAVGMHLVLATQSPRVDVITGMIKANVPSRIAFAVSSQTDSRVILDQNGAESLLGQGDMLFSPAGSSRLQRIQGAYVDEEEILVLTDHWRKQGEPDMQEGLLEAPEEEGAPEDADDDGFDPDEDPLLEEAIRLVAELGTASTSMLQRRLRLGYTRAGRLIDMLERRGVISGYEGSKPRQVLVTEADLPRVLANLREAGRLAAARDEEPAPAAVLADDPDPSLPDG